METRNYRDIACGVILAGLGAFVALYSMHNNTLGTIARMGPGFLPAILGALLFVLGLIVLAASLLRSMARGENFIPNVDYRSFLSIMMSVIAFAVLIEPFGIVPAVTATIVIARFAEDRIDIPRSLVFGLTVSGVVTLIFNFALGMNFHIARWPF